MATNLHRCALGIATADLSAWRDHVLAAHEAQVLTAHIPACTACQQRLDQFAAIAQVMQRQHVPNLRERVWRGMQPRMTPPQRFGLPRAASLGGLSAALVVIILFVTLLAFSQRHSGGLTIIPRSDPTVSATATPVGSPRAAPTVLTPTQAWGNYAKQVITHADIGGYEIQDVFPDGSTCIGERYGGPATATANTDATVFATIPIAHPTNAQVVYTTPQGGISLFARTDGRFIAWMSTLRDSGGPYSGLEFAGYRDLQTQRVTTLANVGKTSNFVFTIAEMVVDHGYLLWVPENGDHPSLAVINMLTGQSTTIVPHISGGTAPAIQFSYPYVFYTDDNATTAHLYNLATGHDTLLSQVQPQVSAMNVYALSGSTVFWNHGDSNHAVIDELDHADQAGAHIQRIADSSIAGSHVSLYDLAANDRLIVWSDTSSIFAWDRVQHRLIAVANGAGDLAMFVHGTTFAFGSGSGDAASYTFIDTTKLPTTAPHN